MNDDSQKTTDFVAAWVACHRDQIGGTQLKFIQQDTHGRTFCAEFETVKHLIQFCAWDHRSCLDILALDKASGTNAYVVSGECDGTAALSQRLHDFLSWLTVHDSKHAMHAPKCKLYEPASRYRRKVVRSLHYDGGTLTIDIQGEGFSYARLVFGPPVWFRVLDERDLGEFWPAYSEPNGWLWEVQEGGWMELEVTRPLERFPFASALPGGTVPPAAEGPSTRAHALRSG